MSNDIIGIKQADGSFYPLLQEGNPETKALELTTVRDDQTTVQVNLYKMPADKSGEPEYVDTLLIENLLPHPKEEHSLPLHITIDENNVLTAEVSDPETGNKSDTTVSLVTLSELDIKAEPDFTLSEDVSDFNTDEFAVDGEDNADFDLTPDELDESEAIPDFDMESAALSGFDLKAEDSSNTEANPFDMSDFETNSTDTTDTTFDMPDFETDSPDTPDTAFDMPDFETDSPDTPDTTFDMPDFGETPVSSTSFADDSFSFDSIPDFENEDTKASTNSTSYIPPVYDPDISEEYITKTERKGLLPMIISIICAILCTLAVIAIFLFFPKQDVPLTQIVDENIVTVEPPIALEPVPENTVITKEENIIIIAEEPVVIPEPPAQAVEPVKPADVRYLIKWGDTLWDLSATYYRNPWLYHVISNANNIKNPDYIIAGTYISIPAR